MSHPHAGITGSRLWRAALRSLFGFLILLAAWPAIAPVFRPVWRVLVPAPIDLLGSRIHIEAVAGSPDDPVASDTPRMDTLVLLQLRGYSGGKAKLPTSTFHHGFLPLAVFLALLWGASTGKPSERHSMALMGFLVLYGFLVLRLGAAVLQLLNASKIEGRPALPVGPTLSWFVGKLKSLFWDEPTVSILVPVIVWALLETRRTLSPSSGKG